jgi:hypothetical protein
MGVRSGMICLILAGAFVAKGQSLMENTFHIPHPPDPQLIGFMSIMGMGRFITDASFPPKGPVARVEYQERNTSRPNDVPPVPSRNLVQEFDEEKHVVGLTDVGRSRTVSTYQGDRLLTRTTTALLEGKAISSLQESWIYDAAGHLTEFKALRGGKFEDHFTGLRYDRQGRVAGSEYRHGPDDALQYRMEYEYLPDGRHIRAVLWDMNNEPYRKSTRTLDEKGRVTGFEETTREWTTHKWSEPRQCTFRYDEKGRLIEQEVRAEDAERRSHEENEPIPAGKVSLSYDDANRTRKIEYSGNGIAIKTTQTLDENGGISAMSVVTPGEELRVEFECTYDDHDNWTECKRWGVQQGNRSLSGWWTRKITYR